MLKDSKSRSMAHTCFFLNDKSVSKHLGRVLRSLTEQDRLLSSLPFAILQDSRTEWFRCFPRLSPHAQQVSNARHHFGRIPTRNEGQDRPCQHPQQ
jgi:hypothetical protein